jgi:hypothetical protein
MADFAVRIYLFSKEELTVGVLPSNQVVGRDPC